MKLFDCLHVIVTYSLGITKGIGGPLISNQMDMCLGKPDWSSEYNFLKDIQNKTEKVVDTKVTPIIKYSCCYYEDTEKLPDWYMEQNGKWTGEEILQIYADSPL